MLVENPFYQELLKIKYVNLKNPKSKIVYNRNKTNQPSLVDFFSLKASDEKNIVCLRNTVFDVSKVYINDVDDDDSFRRNGFSLKDINIFLGLINQKKHWTFHMIFFLIFLPGNFFKDREKFLRDIQALFQVHSV